MTELDARLQKLKADITREREYWHPFHEGLLRLDPAFLEAYFEMNQAPVTASRLPRKVVELMYVAADGSINHLYEKGLRRHIESALAHGATPHEVLEVIEMTCSLAGHTHAMAMPILLDEAHRLGRTRPHADLTPEQQALKQEFVDGLGYWPEWGDAAFALAPRFMRGFLRFLSIPWTSGHLEPKVKAFVGIALHAAPTTLHEPGVRLNVRRALQFGATEEEIADVLQCAGAIAIHTCTLAVPMLVDAMGEKAGDPQISMS